MERRTFLRTLGTFATGLIVAPEIWIPKTIFIPPAPRIVLTDAPMAGFILNPEFFENHVIQSYIRNLAVLTRSRNNRIANGGDPSRGLLASWNGMR